MLPPLCMTCGTLLANIQLPYQRDMDELCAKYGIDNESIARSLYTAEFIKHREKIVAKYVSRMCCKFRLTNFSDIVRIIN